MVSLTTQKMTGELSMSGSVSLMHGSTMNVYILNYRSVKHVQCLQSCESQMYLFTKPAVCDQSSWWQHTERSCVSNVRKEIIGRRSEQISEQLTLNKIRRHLAVGNSVAQTFSRLQHQLHTFAFETEERTKLFSFSQIFVWIFWQSSPKPEHCSKSTGLHWQHLSVASLVLLFSVRTFVFHRTSEADVKSEKVKIASYGHGEKGQGRVVRCGATRADGGNYEADTKTLSCRCHLFLLFGQDLRPPIGQQWYQVIEKQKKLTRLSCRQEHDQERVLVSAS